MRYKNKQEAIEAGPTKNPVDVNGNYYIWKICPQCKELKPVGVNRVTCSPKCRGQSDANKINLHDRTVYQELSKQDYLKFHTRLWKARGKASKCIYGCTEGPFQWANISKRYGDIDDYIELCVFHHIEMDRGGPWPPLKIYITSLLILARLQDMPAGIKKENY